MNEKHDLFSFYRNLFRFCYVLFCESLKTHFFCMEIVLLRKKTKVNFVLIDDSSTTTFLLSHDQQHLSKFVDNDKQMKVVSFASSAAAK